MHRKIALSRIELADITAPDIEPLAKKIAAERGSILDLYKMLLHSPPVASGWLSYLTAIRHYCALPGALRELAIMRIAHLNGASYEAEQHAGIAIKEGLSKSQLEHLTHWETSDQFDVCQRTVLAYTDAMTRYVQVPTNVFQAVRDQFNDRLLVELTATIAAYNMVSRFLEALQIHAGHEDGART
jgi:alkylhydroperoxidase family enzyme